MRKIPALRLGYSKEEKNDITKGVNEILNSGFLTMGEKVTQFERLFAEFVGVKYAVAVNSGTAALHLALSLFDIKNKEVILPSISFVSTAHAITYNGGKPVFADVDPLTLNIDPESISLDKSLSLLAKKEIEEQSKEKSTKKK